MSLTSAKCPNCGASIQVDSDRKEAFCSYCGSKVTVEEALNLVKIDTSEELANLYQIARRAKDQNDSEQAYKYYEQILVKDPNSWEATFYVVYYREMQCKIAEITSAAQAIYKNTTPVFELIKKYVTNPKDRDEAVNEVCNKLANIAEMLFNASESHYKEIDYRIKNKYAGQFNSNAFTSGRIVYHAGDAFESVFGNEYKNLSVALWKRGVEYTNRLLKQKSDIICYMKGGQDEVNAHISIMHKYEEKIASVDSSYKAPEVSNSACYIATAVYGAYDAPEVMILREFRDATLKKSIIGRTFIKIYYKLSPALAKRLSHPSFINRTVKGVLDKWVGYLSNK